MITMSKQVLFILLALWVLSTPGYAGIVLVPGASGGSMNVMVTSLKEARFNTTIRQKYDFSCGSAALATLLTYHYEDPVSESSVFKEMFNTGDQQKIREYGFSLLDIKKYLQSRGYAADGFRASLDKLETLGVPAIVLINHKGYRHFVVLKGVHNENVLVGDPSLGIRTMPRTEFEPMWNGLLFLIRNKKQVANQNFNKNAEWNFIVKAPLGTGMRNRELANVTWLLPPSSDF
jgi:predicted double-glycine peptidase